MTIRRNEPWGVDVRRPTGLRRRSADADLAASVEDDPTAPYAVDAGDVARALGGGTGAGERVQRVPMDALRVEVDGTARLAVAHVVARRAWWRGPIVAVMNVDHLGAWNVAPRAHPNDGHFDVVEVASAMPLRARWEARRRLPTGTHAPHPDITVRTSTEETWTFDSPLDIWIDGARIGRATRLRVVIEPDAYALHV